MLSYAFTIVNENEPNMDSFTYLEESFWCMIKRKKEEIYR